MYLQQQTIRATCFIDEFTQDKEKINTQWQLDSNELNSSDALMETNFLYILYFCLLF